VVLLAFALLGIGNTIVQVAANPLLVGVVPEKSRSSFLSFSQFVKALGSMLAAPLAGWLASRFGDWKLVFLVFGIVSIITAVSLALVPIQESRQQQQRASVASSFKLLGNRYISMMVLGIFLLVGVDVGINSVSGQYLLANGTPQALAESGRSFYFFGKMLGTLGGALLLTRLPARQFLLYSSVAGLLSLAALLLVPAGMPAMIIIFLAGLGLANIFPLIFSLSVERFPERANEISGLVIMAVTGGAVLPLLTGWVSDLSSLTAGMLVLVVCTVYFLILSFYAAQKK
jgi:fucose permease